MLLILVLLPGRGQCAAEETHTLGNLCPARVPGHPASVAGGSAALAGASIRIAGFGGVAA